MRGWAAVVVLGVTLGATSVWHAARGGAGPPIVLAAVAVVVMVVALRTGGKQ